MAWLLRLLAALAAAITSLFVARDALNFGVIQTLLMITLVIGAAALVVAWKSRRQFELSTPTASCSTPRTCHQCGSSALGTDRLALDKVDTQAVRRDQDGNDKSER
jgi:predicted anti-sigma-YlaC factor YlaD